MAEQEKYLRHSIHITFSATQCYAEMMSPVLPFASSEEFHTYLELYANTVYHFLAFVNYEDQLKHAHAQRAHVLRPFNPPVTDVQLDVPATLDDVWNLLQQMELRFKHS
jgi:hypothetical protein